MFSTDWRTSRRQYGITIERDVRIPVGQGITLDSDIFRPDDGARFPAILAVHPYPKAAQSMAMMPEGNGYARAFIEAGDFNFYVRRGYAFIIANIRGSFGSDGFFGNINPDPQAIQDICQAIQWVAAQPWCDGNIGMFGVSYFSVMQKRVAALRPPHLKTIFAPYGWSEAYRDLYYHGGILAHGFLDHWGRNRASNFRIENQLKKAWGAARYAAAIQAALEDAEVTAIPCFKAALLDPETGINPLYCEIILNRTDNEYHRERAVDFSADPALPAYFGADWGMFGFHLPGDVRAYEEWKGPKRLTIGPPIYLDRPLYQYDYESLRWFDYWLKGMDTKILDEAPVKLFIIGTDEWKEVEDWPVPGTRWTPFYLHAGGLLSEHEFWPNEGASTFEESPFGHGAVEFTTPPMVENTEICGPIVLNLWGSTTDTDVFWFASLWQIDEAGEKRMLTRGWLRGSHRRLDAERSKPWQPYHSHRRREPLEAGRTYEFNIEIRPYGILLRRGQRLVLRIKCADDETPTNMNELTSHGHIQRPGAAHVTVHHNAQFPSHLLLPITSGNRIGTFISGGRLPPLQQQL